jgi:hypothetical protein
LQVDKAVPVVFHYNKAHNQDPHNIPPWVVKVRGESFYVSHMTVDPGVGFSTKETPDNEATKASLKVKGRIRIESFPSGTVEAFVY